MSSCSEAIDKCCTGALAFAHVDTGQLIIVPTRCHRYGCPRCGVYRYYEARAKALAGSPERHIVLTLRCRPHIPLAAQVRFIRKKWARLLCRIRKVWGPMEYVAVLELQKNGTPHLHILQRGTFIDQDWLSRAWLQLTGAFKVWIEKVPVAPRAVKEITKYLCKTAAALEDKVPGISVFTYSRGWLPDDFDHTSDRPPEWVFKEWIGGGWSRIREVIHYLGGDLLPLSPGSRARVVHFPRAPPLERVDQLISDGSFTEATIASLLEAEYRRQTTGQGDLTDALARVDYARECTREIPAPLDLEELSCPSPDPVASSSLW